MPDRKARSRPGSSRAKRALAALLVATAAGASQARADVQIHGTPDALRVEVTKASIAEVLTALGTKFNGRYRSDLPLDQPIDGAYRGSLNRVISRVLNGYSYVVEHKPEAFEILIIEHEPKHDGDDEAGARPRPQRRR